MVPGTTNALMNVAPGSLAARAEAGSTTPAAVMMAARLAANRGAQGGQGIQGIPGIQGACRALRMCRT